MLLFGRTQRAIDTPFEPNRITGLFPGGSGINSEECQSAIEEAKSAAFNNDRYPVLASYGANANVGRYLEVWPSVSSNDAPFTVPENSRLVTLVLGAVSTSTGTLGVFKTSDLVTPVATYSLAAQKRAVFTSLSVPFNALDQIAFRVTAGTFGKPYICAWVNTSI